MKEELQQYDDQKTDELTYPPLADAPPKTVFKPKGRVSGLVCLFNTLILFFCSVTLFAISPHEISDYIVFCVLILLLIFGLYYGIILYAYPIKQFNLLPKEFMVDTDLHIPWTCIESVTQTSKLTKCAVFKLQKYDSIIFEKDKEPTTIREIIYMQTNLLLAIVFGTLTFNFKWRQHRKLYRDKNVIGMFKLSKEIQGYDMLLYKWQVGGNTDRFVKLCQAFIDHSRKEQLPVTE